jgi:hypothetical protein
LQKPSYIGIRTHVGDPDDQYTYQDASSLDEGSVCEDLDDYASEEDSECGDSDDNRPSSDEGSACGDENKYSYDECKDLYNYLET